MKLIILALFTTGCFPLLYQPNSPPQRIGSAAQQQAVHTYPVTLGDDTLRVELPCKIGRNQIRKMRSAVWQEWKVAGMPTPPESVRLGQCPRRTRDVADRVADLVRRVFASAPTPEPTAPQPPDPPPPIEPPEIPLAMTHPVPRLAGILLRHPSEKWTPHPELPCLAWEEHLEEFDGSGREQLLAAYPVEPYRTRKNEYIASTLVYNGGCFRIVRHEECVPRPGRTVNDMVTQAIDEAASRVVHQVRTDREVPAELRDEAAAWFAARLEAPHVGMAFAGTRIRPGGQAHANFRGGGPVITCRADRGTDGPYYILEDGLRHELERHWTCYALMRKNLIGHLRQEGKRGYHGFEPLRCGRGRIESIENWRGSRR